MSNDNGRVLLIFTVVAVFASIIFGLIAGSFGYLDYFEYGFRRQKSTTQIFTDKVYFGGRYLIGPDFEFKTYPSVANTIELDPITVFSKDTLEVFLNVQLQYFLRPEQLDILHRKFQLTYDSVIRSSVMDALKGAAVAYTTEQFIKDRNLIEKAMEEAVRLRISGNCCESDCKMNKCRSKCIPIADCTSSDDMGLMVNLRYFHLSSITMPYKVYRRYLKALLLVELSQMEKYRLREAVVKKQVYEEVRAVYNLANEISQNATAQARLIVRRAEADSIKTIGTARSEGLEILMEKCGITDGKQKMSLHYLDTLGTSSKVNMAVDFKNYVVGSG